MPKRMITCTNQKGIVANHRCYQETDFYRFFFFLSLEYAIDGHEYAQQLE